MPPVTACVPKGGSVGSLKLLGQHTAQQLMMERVKTVKKVNASNQAVALINGASSVNIREHLGWPS